MSTYPTALGKCLILVGEPEVITQKGDFSSAGLDGSQEPQRSEIYRILFAILLWGSIKSLKLTWNQVFCPLYTIFKNNTPLANLLSKKFSN